MRHPGRTPPFRDPSGRLVPGSIAEAGYRRLGGVDQWVMMRGESVANPAVILLHGGPGLSETPFFRYFNHPLERHFVVAYWDQRGAGKSFDRAIPRASMTVEQLVADLDELVEVVRRRVAQPKVVIFGHSWGATLGALYCARYPEKVAAYVASGQIGDAAAAEAASYAFAVAEAQRLGNERVLKKLRAIGPPPYSASAVFVERSCLQRLDGGVGPRMLRDIARIIHGTPEVSFRELPGIWRAFHWTLDAMWPEVSTLNLLTLAPELQVPVFFFVGRRDHWVPPETSIAYFDVLRAPSKALVWFETAGHETFADDPEKFNRTMVELVRPVVVRRQRAAVRELRPVGA